MTVSSDLEVTVNTLTGEAFITVTGLAKKLNVPRKTVSDCVNRHQDYKPNQPLTGDLVLFAATYFALHANAPTQEAKDLLTAISRAGARAWLYHEAGYVIQAVPIQPKSPIELATENVAQAQAMLELIVNQEKMKLELVMKQEIIDQKLIVTNENPEYRTVAAMRKLDPDGVYDGNLLTRKRLELELPHAQLYAPDGYPTVNTYHIHVWKSTYPHLEF